MSWRKTVLFFLVLLAVAGFYYLKIWRGNPAESTFSLSSDAARSPVHSLAHGKSIIRLTLRDSSKKTEISFSKTNGQKWRITKPIDYPAETAIVEGFSALLKLSPRLRQFSTEGVSLKEFGLDSPHLSICISTNQKPEEKCLWVGSDAPAFKGAYTKWGDESKYFLVDANFVAAFDKSLYSARKKQVFTLTDREIKTVRFRSPDHEYELNHQGKQWWLDKPSHALVGSDAAELIFVSLNGIYVKEFLDAHHPEDQKFGFKQPARIIQITFADGTKQTLIQGSEVPGRDAYYAQGSDGKTPLLISLGKLNKLEAAFKALTS